MQSVKMLTEYFSTRNMMTDKHTRPSNKPKPTKKRGT